MHTSHAKNAEEEAAVLYLLRQRQWLFCFSSSVLNSILSPTFLLSSLGLSFISHCLLTVSCFEWTNMKRRSRRERRKWKRRKRRKMWDEIKKRTMKVKKRSGFIILYYFVLSGITKNPFSLVPSLQNTFFFFFSWFKFLRLDPIISCDSFYFLFPFSSLFTVANVSHH